MRRQILTVALAAVCIAVLLLGLPLGLVLRHLVVVNERAELESLALRATIAVPRQTGDPAELPAAEAGQQLGVYDLAGNRTAGSGPARLDPVSHGALSGKEVSGTYDGHVVQVVPVITGERVFGVVRAASDGSELRQRTWVWWLGLFGTCLVAGLGAAVFAARASRRLAAPVSELAVAARSLGEGDFSARAPASGVAEIDTVAKTLNSTAEHVAALLERERSFARTASHQLRTPLTQLRLELEAGLEGDGDVLRRKAQSAIDSADQLALTIDELLELSRGESFGQQIDLCPLVVESAEEWRGALAARGRRLSVVTHEEFQIIASGPAVRQILTVLLDNALNHGAGTVVVEVRDAHGAVAIDVTDQGSVPVEQWSAGRMGLALAQSLAQANRGRILVANEARSTRVTLLLPGDNSD